jgi:AcrR family transcriptional regulator
MRSDPEKRKEQILQAAIELAEKSRYNIITRREVAKAADVSPALINHYFNYIRNLRYEVLERACKTRRLKIIAQAVVDGDSLVFVLTDNALRKKSLKAVNDSESL